MQFTPHLKQTTDATQFNSLQTPNLSSSRTGKFPIQMWPKEFFPLWLRPSPIFLGSHTNPTLHNSRNVLFVSLLVRLPMAVGTAASWYSKTNKQTIRKAPVPLWSVAPMCFADSLQHQAPHVAAGHTRDLRTAYSMPCVQSHPPAQAGLPGFGVSCLCLRAWSASVSRSGDRNDLMWL